MHLPRPADQGAQAFRQSCHLTPFDLWNTSSVSGDLAARSDRSASHRPVVSAMYRSCQC
jgi:hypothetical protein